MIDGRRTTRRGDLPLTESRRSRDSAGAVLRGSRPRADRPQFGGPGDATEKVAATEADVQLFWGEPLDGIAERVDRLRDLTGSLDRDLPPLEFRLRITTLVRDTTEEAWRDAEAKVADMAVRPSALRRPGHQPLRAVRHALSAGDGTGR